MPLSDHEWDVMLRAIDAGKITAEGLAVLIPAEEVEDNLARAAARRVQRALDCTAVQEGGMLMTPLLERPNVSGRLFRAGRHGHSLLDEF